jgi:hypothetical protein
MHEGVFVAKVQTNPGTLRVSIKPVEQLGDLVDGNHLSCIFYRDFDARPFDVFVCDKA